MGNQLVWQDRYNIGVEFIDREHRKLFGIMNKLLGAVERGDNSQWIYQEGIKYFKGHAMKHFAEEEVYMASIGYPGFETHRRLHDNFRRKTLPALERELEMTNYSQEAVSHFMGVCVGWLIGHTMTEDRAIGGKMTSKWVGLLPEEEQEAMKEVIKQLVFELFGLKAKVISSHYGGEKFGKGIYYHLVYATSQGDRWEIIMAFEEKVLLNTVGRMMGGAAEELDTMMVNATRYTAQQFVNRIKEHFPNADLYELKEEKLLTYDQFSMEFGREHPQCSLLFDTGEGYFAYCVIALHLLQEGLGVGTAITPENAMIEIGEYLKKKETAQKKILVVDDSAVMCQAMKELLEGDYQVVTANSGIAAIRSMTLNRPDLVLLDYEMPVCDGRQVLEMIRSEVELANIPVIFLTGRVDRESIEKVKVLKPEGYLIKSLKPAEIKKNVDFFFAQRAAGQKG